MDSKPNTPGPNEVTVAGCGPLSPPLRFVLAPDQSSICASQFSGEAQQDGLLLEYWRILRRHKAALIVAGLAGLLLGVLVALPRTPVYQARSLLEIQDINPDSFNIRQTNSNSDTGSTTNALADIQTQIAILQNDTLIERTLAKLRTRYPGSSRREPGLLTKWRRELVGVEPPAHPTLEEEVKAAASNLKVNEAGQTRIVELLFDSIDPVMAADFLNTLSSEYIEENVEARWKMSQRTGDWLSRQLDDMRIKLERSDDALQNYARRTGLLFTGDKQNVSEEKLRQLQAELSKVQADRVSRQSRYEMASSSPPEALPDILTDASLREYQTKLTELRGQRAELGTSFKPEYIKVKRLDAQVTSLEAALAAQRTAILGRIRNEFEESQRREKLLAEAYATQAKLLTRESEKAIHYNILKREVDTNRQIYEAMLQRVKEASVSSAMRASNVRVVHAARPPGKPYKPRVPLNAALGLLSGLFAGFAFVVMREHADRTLQEPGEINSYLDVPRLGVIPRADKPGRLHTYYIRRRNLKDQEAGSRHQLLLEKRKSPETPERVELVTWQRKPSPVAEAFRAAVTSLLCTGQNGSRPRVLVITSAGPGEGKTTVTSNLGIAFAEIRRKTLLIDADLRRPSLHTVFDLPNGHGLCNLLGANPLPEDALDGLIQETRIPGLFVLTSGEADGEAASLLYSANLPDLLAKFKNEFDMVLVDTPPMLELRDARAVGKLADAVLLVARAGQTTRDEAMAARERFAEDQTRVLGTILNDWDPKRSSGGYHYSGYYSGSRAGS